MVADQANAGGGAERRVGDVPMAVRGEEGTSHQSPVVRDQAGTNPPLTPPSGRGIEGGGGVEEELRALGAALEEAEAALVRTQRLAMLGTVAGMIAHEVNNMLTPVMGTAQLALRSPGDEALTRKALEMAVTGTQRASEVAGAILAFAREGVRPSVEETTAEATWSKGHVANGPNVAGGERGEGLPRARVGACVAGVMDCLGGRLRKAGVEVVLQIDDGATVAMRGVVLEQVVMNLVLNAERAAEGDGKRQAGGGTRGRVEVEARVVERVELPAGAVVWGGGEVARGGAGLSGVDGGGWVMVTVRDYGRGMSAARLAEVFGGAEGRWGRVGGAMGAEGNGFGLLVCGRLAEQAGGFLWAKSVEGEGSWVGICVRAAA